MTKNKIISLQKISIILLIFTSLEIFLFLSGAFWRFFRSDIMIWLNIFGNPITYSSVFLIVVIVFLFAINSIANKYSDLEIERFIFICILGTIFLVLQSWYESITPFKTTNDALSFSLTLLGFILFLSSFRLLKKKITEHTIKFTSESQKSLKVIFGGLKFSFICNIGLQFLFTIIFHSGDTNLDVFSFIFWYIVIMICLGKILSLIGSINFVRLSKTSKYLTISLKSKTSEQEFNELQLKITYTSDKPEELIRNVNYLHKNAKKFIEDGEFSKGIEILHGEIYQYNEIIDLLTSFNLTDPIEMTIKKRDSIKLLLDKVRKSALLGIYHDLETELVRQKENENYPKIAEILEEMGDIITQQVDLSEIAGNKVDVKKYSALLDDLKEQENYYGFFVEYKNFEKEFNNIIHSVNTGELKEGMNSLSLFKPNFLKFNSNLQSHYRNLPNYQQLSLESKKMGQNIEELGQKISNQYTTLLSGTEQDPISFKEMYTDFSIPQLSKIDQEDDLQDFITDLDNQFALWDGKISQKMGKL
ncbi:hypothetical protein [Candidatus Lokiarchaeum ossiferum]|uniref:hypothetical protein n=1 Tax=Candidatus Lokiarchaeum ossiferum TaxID=2951803 RepID=UPI00352D5F05